MTVDGDHFDITTNNILGFGAGFQYKKFIIGARLLGRRSIISDFGSGDYHASSLILGYQIF